MFTNLFNGTQVTWVLLALLGIACIYTAVKQVQRYKIRFTRATFYWVVNFVFMAVSVIKSGRFFGIADIGWEMYLGYAVGWFLDLVTIVLMEAMLEARYREEAGRATLFLLFIIATCGTSFFANLAISLDSFNAATMLPNAGWAIQDMSPYFLASFPLFIVLTSIAGEMILGIKAIDDPTEFRTQEQKRYDVLQIRNEFLAKRQAELAKTAELRGGFGWWRRRSAAPTVDHNVLVQQVIEIVLQQVQPQIDAITVTPVEPDVVTTAIVPVTSNSPTAPPKATRRGAKWEAFVTFMDNNPGASNKEIEDAIGIPTSTRGRWKAEYKLLAGSRDV